MAKANLEIIGEAIDRLVTVPMSNWTILKGIPLMELYQAARDKVKEPLTLAAAKRLAAAAGPEDTIFILSGFVLHPSMRAETDGPTGAAALARVLHLGLGVTPVLLTDELIKEPLARTCNAAGLLVSDDAHVPVGKRGRRMIIQGFPLDHVEAEERAKLLMDRFHPRAVIAVERPGWNRKKVHHSGGGFDVSSTTAKLDYLFIEAQHRGIPTIGIGDLGNEMGMGLLADAIRQHVPHGEACLCPCEGGIACDLAADVGIICNISNWGAYGVEACLAALLEDLDLMHDMATERAMIRECVRAGAIDSVSGLMRPWVDGEPEDIHAYVVEMLRSIVRHGVSENLFTRDYRKTWEK